MSKEKVVSSYFPNVGNKRYWSDGRG
jgi:hypothetical protein